MEKTRRCSEPPDAPATPGMQASAQSKASTSAAIFERSYTAAISILQRRQAQYRSRGQKEMPEASSAASCRNRDPKSERGRPETDNIACEYQTTSGTLAERGSSRSNGTDAVQFARARSRRMQHRSLWSSDSL